ncbi:SIMPL domain-containing protein [Kineococcus sp. TBRC 1896]|uniref:SIMPL domain-containing protein n=1 Tax=Kineococcus mangrovi TaxID=1660183 RepID=A0ABV4I5E4_9ACTN
MSGRASLTVQGEGRVEGPPELATVSAVLHTSGRSPTVVTGALADLARQVHEVLSGFAPDSVRTDPLSVSPVVDRRSGTRITGWTGRFSTRVTLAADATDLSALVVAFTGLPGVAVDGPWWSLRPGSDLERRARAAAVAAAVARAHDDAAALGATLGDLLELSDAGGSPFPTPRMAATAFPAADGSPPELDLDPQPQTVAAVVTARFELVDVPPSAELPGAPGRAG